MPFHSSIAPNFPMRLIFAALAATLAMLSSVSAFANSANAPETGQRLAGFAFEEAVRGDADGALTPLLIAFHYSGGSARESFENYDQLSGPVRILVPLGAYPKRQGLSYFPLDYYAKPPDQQFKIAMETVDELAAFVKATGERYGRKPVVTGISQGGDISLLLAIFHPDLIQSAYPFAAVIPDGLMASQSQPMRRAPPILIMQGEADPIVDVAVTRERVKELQSWLPISLRTYPDLGHDISPEMKNEYTPLIEQDLRQQPLHLAPQP